MLRSSDHDACLDKLDLFRDSLPIGRETVIARMNDETSRIKYVVSETHHASKAFDHDFNAINLSQRVALFLIYVKYNITEICYFVYVRIKK